MPRMCVICADMTIKTVVDSMLTKGLSAVFISHELAAKMNTTFGDTTVLSHKRHFLPKLPETAKSEKDLAILVRDRTYDAIIANRLEPTVKDGVAAQALIDRRAEKIDDRNTALALARLLSGGTSPDLLMAPDSVVVIEGVARDVEPVDA